MGSQFPTFVLDDTVRKEESLTNKKISHKVSHVDHRQERKKEILEMGTFF